MVVHIHGHCHNGAFLDRVHGETGFPVVNPGSLHEKEYGTLKLVKEGSDWRVSEAVKKYL